MIVFKKGNLFDTRCSSLVNTVNCVGVMGKGIALEFKNRFPEMFEAYKKVLVNDKGIANLIMKKTHFLTYVAFVEQFESVDKLAEWLMLFYGNMPTEYAEASKQQTTSNKNTTTRINIVKESVEKFLNV